MLGFDMDFTLALYKIPEYHISPTLFIFSRPSYDELTFRLLRDLLINELGYPKSIANLTFDPEFIVRGVVLDQKIGNVRSFSCKCLAFTLRLSSWTWMVTSSLVITENGESTCSCLDSLTLKPHVEKRTVHCLPWLSNSSISAWESL